jgi:hypothetical protein
MNIPENVYMAYDAIYKQGVKPRVNMEDWKILFDFYNKEIAGNQNSMYLNGNNFPKLEMKCTPCYFKVFERVRYFIKNRG